MRREHAGGRFEPRRAVGRLTNKSPGARFGPGSVGEAALSSCCMGGLASDDWKNRARQISPDGFRPAAAASGFLAMAGRIVMGAGVRRIFSDA